MFNCVHFLLFKLKIGQEIIPIINCYTDLNATNRIYVNAFDRSISCDVLESNIYHGVIHVHIDRNDTACAFYGKFMRDICVDRRKNKRLDES